MLHPKKYSNISKNYLDICNANINKLTIHRYTISQARGSRMTQDEYRLVKSVDFDACDEQIVLTKSSKYFSCAYIH